MRVLVTGANGFLGKEVVVALAARGHEVRALVRPSKSAPACWPAEGIEVVRGDLRCKSDLPKIVDGIEAIVHLAACVVGDDETQFANAVVATENLLDAAQQVGIDRLILCSSFSVYDWRKSKRCLDEQTPLEAQLYARDGYAIAKTWQERLVRRHSEQNGWRLTVLRPGFIWAPDADVPAAIGQSSGRWHLVFGGFRPLPITYVKNCAECFATAVDHRESVGETFNVVDEERISAWQFMGKYMRENQLAGTRVFVPYWLGLAVAAAATTFFRLTLGRSAKLPGLLTPIRYRARFRPLRFSSAKAQSRLGWRPRWSFSDTWLQTRRPLAQTVADASPATTSAKFAPEFAVD